jgi:thiamine biosynthesis lipoprotein
MYIRNIQHAFILLAAVLALSACNPNTSDHQLGEFSGLTMGTSWSVKVIDLPGTINQSTVDDSISKTLAAISRSMSTYDTESELSRFNSSSSTDWFAASDALVEVLGAANEVSKLTGGAFDITVGPLVNLWGFGPQDSHGDIPGKDEIDSALARTGYRNIELKQAPAAVRKQLPGLYIDLSAIAKGYAVDRIAELLGQQGIDNYLVEIGGELRARGHNERGTSWRVGIERPLTTARSVYAAIEINEAGLATSGDYRNYFEQDGQRYSHTINPLTGRPVTHRLASVTVIAASTMRADALATAMMVLGPEDGYALAERESIVALFIIRADDGFIDRPSSAFTHYQADTRL